jgi:hypothetical protein
MRWGTVPPCLAAFAPEQERNIATSFKTDDQVRRDTKQDETSGK